MIDPGAGHGPAERRPALPQPRKDCDSGKAPSAATESGHRVVRMRVPARSEYVSILRAACGQLAPVADCTPAEIADLRLAVDEACGLLLRNRIRTGEGTADDDLVATFAVDGPCLYITVETEADVALAPDEREFGWAILAALVDDFAWYAEDSRVRVELRKLRTAGRWEWTRSSK